MPGPFVPPGPAVGGFNPTGALDGPPPNPMIAGPQQLPGQMGAGGAPGSRSLPPEVLQGALQSVTTMLEMMDSLASMFPDLAPHLAFAKDGLTKFQAQITLAGGGPTTAAQAGTPMPNGLPASPSPSM